MQHVLLEMVPNAGGVVLLVRACSVQELWSRCTLWRSAPPRNSHSTYAAVTNVNDPLPNIVISITGGMLHSDTVVEEVV